MSKMTYTTKFAAGQSVYMIDKSYLKGVCSHCRKKSVDVFTKHFEAKKIKIHSVYITREAGKTEVKYTSKSHSFVLRDEDLFRTKKECNAAMLKTCTASTAKNLAESQRHRAHTPALSATPRLCER